YRIYGLPPGDYYVSATFRGGDMAIMDLAAGVGTMSFTTAAGGGGGGPAGPSGSNTNSGYAPTYFPGPITRRDGQKIQPRLGQEAQNTDFALLPVRLAKVTGSVVSSEGRPMDGAMVNAVPRGGDFTGFTGFGNTARADKNGNFTMMNVPPGDYNLQVRGGM